MLWRHRTHVTTLTRLGITPRCCSADPLGEAIPATMQHCEVRPVSAPWHCAAYPCTADAPSPRRGPAEPSNAFPVSTQGCAVTSGRRERSSPSLSTLCGHPRHCSATPGTVTTSPMLLECTGTRRRHDRHCVAYGPPVDGTLELARGRRPGSRPLHRYPRSRSCLGTGRATTPRLDEIRQDGRQLRRTARHASTRRRIVRHACKLLPPWPIKGGAAPLPRGRDESGRRSYTRFLPSPRYWHSPQSIPLGLGGPTSSPTTLVAPLYKHHGANQYSAPSTPLLDVQPRPEPG
jgi:hypothetical protein